jgi:hypothetical protein
MAPPPPLMPAMPALGAPGASIPIPPHMPAVPFVGSPGGPPPSLGRSGIPAAGSPGGPPGMPTGSTGAIPAAGSPGGPPAPSPVGIQAAGSPGGPPAPTTGAFPPAGSPGGPPGTAAYPGTRVCIGSGGGSAAAGMREQVRCGTPSESSKRSIQRSCVHAAMITRSLPRECSQSKCRDASLLSLFCSCRPSTCNGQCCHLQREFKCFGPLLVDSSSRF